ncbi:hypothetical protein [Burkholderia stagnalis]
MQAWKSRLAIVLSGLAGTAVSAIANSDLIESSNALVQPGWMVATHLGAAFVGTACLAYFVLGSRDALNGASAPAQREIGMVPRIGAVSFFVPGHNAFFSVKRCLVLLGCILCLMIQFVAVAPQASDASKAGNPARPLPVIKGKGHLTA